MITDDKYPWEIELEDHWFEWEYGKFNEKLGQYRVERRKLEDLVHESTAPIPCKSWTKDYFFGDRPSNMASLWGEINDYISEQCKKEGWTYSHIETTLVDVNTDPYDDYENLTDCYTVYAIVEKQEDFRESEEYVTQERVVNILYGEVMELKKRIDDKLKKKGE